MKPAIKRWIILTLLILGGTLLLINRSLTNATPVSSSVFSWFEEDANAALYASQSDLINQLKVKAIYQYVSPNTLEQLQQLTAEEAQKHPLVRYAEALKQDEIELYLIYDEQTLDIDDFQSFLSLTSNNQSLLNLSGIVTDIEPFNQIDLNNITQHEKVDLLATFSDFLAKCYQATNAKELSLINTFPTWYDNLSTFETTNLFNASDAIIIMNYNKRQSLHAIDFEVTLCKTLDIPYINAIELAIPDSETGITPDISLGHNTINEIIHHQIDIWKAQNKPENYLFNYHQLRDLIRISKL